MHLKASIRPLKHHLIDSPLGLGLAVKHLHRYRRRNQDQLLIT